MEQEMLRQILDSINELNKKHDDLDKKYDSLELEMKNGFKKYDSLELEMKNGFKKYDSLELEMKNGFKKLEKKVDKNHKQVMDELNLHGRYILEDVARVDKKLNRVIEKNKLSVG